MSITIDKDACTACGACINICPGDLFVRDTEGKAVIAHPDDCWDCAACVKACPTAAIYLSLPFQISEAQLRLYADTAPRETRWTIKSPDGETIREYAVTTVLPPGGKE